MQTKSEIGNHVEYYRKKAAEAEEKWALALRMFERACDNEAKLIMHIIELHRKFADDLQECEHCDGEGTIPEMMTCDYSSSSDAFQPAEEPGEIECDRCKGTGREWPS